MRTSVNIILGMAGLLQDTELNEKQQYYVQFLRSSGESLLTLINKVSRNIEKKAKDVIEPLQYILVVSEVGHFREDDENSRILINTFLKSPSILVDTAENGIIAVARFKHGIYDLVLMDVEMPVMDGYTAVTEMRSWEKQTGRKETPILALTAHERAEDVRKCLEAGYTEHLIKPITRQALLEKLSIYNTQDSLKSEKLPIHADKLLQDLIPSGNRRR